MKLVTLRDGQIGRVADAQVEILDIDDDLRQLIAAGVDAAALPVRATVPLDGLDLAPPLLPGKVVAIGLNYLDHCREANVDPPVAPMIFAKFPSSVAGPHDEIVVDRAVTDSVDWEVELGVVIGKRLTRASRATALEAVFGYTVVNDVSARDVQMSEQQWVRGKSLDTFCPIGPWVVTADEVADPQALRLWTTVNGYVMQDSSTAEMIFGVAELLEYCSHSFTLEPGDLLITGTPWGVGVVREPPVLLRAGDTVIVGVDGVGQLANRVVDLPPIAGGG
ncbi:MAG TPA: fumarylacetoacetate hydrolase family protein [Baekduia sp.]|nr:fumarylacetoacetate hydrolase family protein [Baekduia sp.]